jgi:hypothetical protein
VHGAEEDGDVREWEDGLAGLIFAGSSEAIGDTDDRIAADGDHAGGLNHCGAVDGVVGGGFVEQGAVAEVDGPGCGEGQLGGGASDSCWAVGVADGLIGNVGV